MIWLALFVTDLQWPRGSAQRRFADWLATVECARDDEARDAGAPELSPRRVLSPRLVGAWLTIALLAAVAVGHACGERLIGPLLKFSHALCA